ncbi:7,8-dihydro-6-hydroxymethylpterin-pyrophosphokinase [Aeromonas diversa CDC 2478-85]|uniref:2-amino-4-hydroxy-6-hydroxymethyldihydropteridine pyrophosphokinase n=1 Tax=Aeromonas diversa CDC 2478-85 TaxID=1268237 RepID=N9U2V7_9GAMM|nr:2-amino-4-hydroxy-6-hydroxymethyldihydropteridine diphosphokinase [Aeromonas diversa]ENY72650.1 7,8-dihydro-6-hydroxymethylpterin-pyrophosphokinase [Aeromonas diversa CDC 2478-85]
MTLAFVAIGSNLDAPLEQAQRAVEALRQVTESRLVLASSFYASRPMGPQDQPDYVNAVVGLETALAPLALLDELQRIELEQGRVRKDERWGPRTLDLDLLLYGDTVIEHERLTVPHYGMKVREFVLLPLHEVAPRLSLPCGSSLSDLVAQCPRNGLMVVAPAPAV